MEKTWCVWSLGEVITAESEPQFESHGYPDGHLVFKRADGSTSAIFYVWNAVRIQDKG
ncbi:hypothetical protein QZN01_20875 [Burkholderia cenocepacia]|uniref:hypothetical protein n=1 Tax=Burkholderia cenocepacia TaxID=95486 RepID=UPI00264AFA20|nr:hypothetical protein [Burkholderia cenocepacia]MDN7825109.1 hypothetical protein [Burkholderia cenocepacia]